MWCEFHRIAINTVPDFSNPTLTASRFDTIICQQRSDHRPWVALVRAADPTVKALAYQAAPYTTYLDFPAQGFQSQCPSGISEEQAAANPTWYAKTSGGAFLVNAFGAPPARMLDVGLTAVRNAWSSNARFRAVPGGGVTPFDGIFADDVNNDNSGEVGATLPAAYASWAAWWTAQMGMFAAIYPSFTGAGLQLVPNMSQWGQGNRTATAPILSNVTGAHTEHWMTYYDGSRNGWYHQMLGAADDCVAAGKKFMGTGYGDAAAARYGLASMMLVTSATSKGLTSFSWQGTGPDYGGEYWEPSFDLDIGSPVDVRQSIGGAAGFGAYQRRFTKGWALVNPAYNDDGTTRTGGTTFVLPGGPYSGSLLNRVNTVTLQPGQGALLVDVGTAPTSARIDLNHYIEVTTPSGRRYRWDANQAPGSRPMNMSWRTKIGEGYSDGRMQLARRIDLDYPDLGIGDTITVRTGDGTIVYEGRVEGLPRELTDNHRVGVVTAGWMVHAKDRQCQEIYVDRLRDNWDQPPIARRLALMASNWTMFDIQNYSDPASNRAGFKTGLMGPWVSPYVPISEAWYDAGPNIKIGKVAYSWLRESGNPSDTDPSFVWDMATCIDSAASSGVASSGNLRAAGPGSGLLTAGASSRYAFTQLYYTTTPAGLAGVEYALDWYNVAVYGTHGLTLRTGDAAQPQGIYLSDILKDMAARFCPQLDTSGVQTHTYVVQQASWREPIYPYDAWLELNKYALWHLGVWENKRLDFRPYDFTDYDWRVRTDDLGVTFSPEGPSSENLHNGITVTYHDPSTGVDDVLFPSAYPQLADPDPTNPWNQLGINHWDNIAITIPVVKASAINLGVAALADRLRPRLTGTITVTGTIRDRGGRLQPVSKIRAGDTLSVPNYPNDSVRLIVETDFDDVRKVNRLSIDRPFALVEAILDRQQNALQAAGLT